MRYEIRLLHSDDTQATFSSEVAASEVEARRHVVFYQGYALIQQWFNCKVEVVDRATSTTTKYGLRNLIPIGG